MRLGVAPTRKPVLRSWEVSPATAAEMQTTAPTARTATLDAPVPSFRPSATKISEVRISAAMVIPDTGFDDEPIRPTIRLDTVTKKKLKITISTAPVSPTGTPGHSHSVTASSAATPSTIFSGRSCWVRGRSPPAVAPTCPRPSLNDSTIVGRDLSRVTMPAKPTAPAPT